MSLFDKIKGVLNPNDEYEEYEEYEDDIEEAQAPMQNDYDNTVKTARTPVNFNHTTRDEMPTRNTATTQTGSKLQVVLVKPTGFEDVRAIADNLNRKNTVVLNLEAASKEISQRILDFLGGVAYANSGKISKVANSTYIVTPNHVDMHGEEIGEFDVNSLF